MDPLPLITPYRLVDDDHSDGSQDNIVNDGYRLIDDANERDDLVVDNDKETAREGRLKTRVKIFRLIQVVVVAYILYQWTHQYTNIRRPDFVNHSPYLFSSYYSSTESLKTLLETERLQVRRLGGKKPLLEKEFKNRLAIVRPFCEFDAESLPTTFDVWNHFVPCGASATNGDLDEDISANDMVADLFLFYSQTFSENEVAIEAVDRIIDEYNEPGGWSRCFANIYAIEAAIPQEFDLYIPSAQDELYNWVNGPNRQFEAAFRIIQSGKWGTYDAFFLMEWDMVPIKNNWLDRLFSQIEFNRPFAILGSKFKGDKWDDFYDQLPISLIHHLSGNSIYNTSHELLERLIGQLELEAPSPYNSIPYDYRMSQIVTEGALGIVPTLAPKIMLNAEGENITLPSNTATFSKWWDQYSAATPLKETPVLGNYGATNLLPRHLGPEEYIIHGAKIYAPWNSTTTTNKPLLEYMTHGENHIPRYPHRTVRDRRNPWYTRTVRNHRKSYAHHSFYDAYSFYDAWNRTSMKITLVISEWFDNRSDHLLNHLDKTDHPFSEVIVMLPPTVKANDNYDNMTVVPTRGQHRTAYDYMDLCEADVKTEFFMMTNAYYKVASHVDLMFVPRTFKPVIPFTPATYPFCFQFPYCKENVKIAQRFNPGHNKVVYDSDMVYHTKTRNGFCKEWKKRFGSQGENLYTGRRKKKAAEGKIIGPAGPTGTSYAAFLFNLGKHSMFKFTDRSLYGARDPFRRVFGKDERLNGMSEELRARELERNITRFDCNCRRFETEYECTHSDLGCVWRPRFDSCRPPEILDGLPPICPTSVSPSMTRTEIDPLDITNEPTASPTLTPSERPHWYSPLMVSENTQERWSKALDKFMNGPQENVRDKSPKTSKEEI